MCISKTRESVAIKKPSSNHAGFTLVEVLISASLAGLMLLGGTELFLTSLKVTSRANAQISATTRATVTVARIMDMSRECYGVALPTDASGFVPPVAGTTTANYITTDGSAAALMLTAPSTAAITVNDSTGQTKTAGTDFGMTYTSAAGPTLTLYRSDAHGNPSPNTGQYLWEQGTPPDFPALPSGGQSMTKLGETSAISASIPDQATFVRPDSSTASTPAVEIHLVAADYSTIGGSQTSESATNQIVGKCVLLRNHP